jgi:homoserine O-succinyltransferase/O-acetyltransferase
MSPTQPAKGSFARGLRERPVLVIGLVNNMPDGAIRSTEHQYRRLLTAAGAACNLDVRLDLLTCPGVPRTASAQSELLSHYHSTRDLPTAPVDALIVTGNEPRALALEDEVYWPDLIWLLEWAEEHTVSSIWSCLAAHAATLHMTGTPRHAFDSKLTGVFDCARIVEHALTSTTTDVWTIPHSRQFGLDTEEVLAAGYTPLTVSATAGIDIFIRQRRSLFVMLQGHLEYERDALFKEYVRDIGRFMENQMKDYPTMPKHYFDEVTSHQMRETEKRLVASRSSGATERQRLRFSPGYLPRTWAHPAQTFFRNWLRLIADRKLGPAADAALLFSVDQ